MTGRSGIPTQLFTLEELTTTGCRPSGLDLDDDREDHGPAAKAAVDELGEVVVE
jgi:hypothetical protein